MATTIAVNGTTYEVGAEPDTPLLYVLRNDLGLTGARFGCGQGLCGACTVLVDERPVHSCDTPLWSVVGRRVTTVEGLGADHPVPRAFVAEQAAQCGYCTAGLVVRAAALLDSDPDPSAGAVRAALDGNLCRCGVHNRVVRAVLRAAREGRTS